MTMKRGAFLPAILALLLCASVAKAQTTSASAAYSFADKGGTTFSTTNSSGSMTVGYGVVSNASATASPAGVAIYGYRSNGVLVTEAGVPAAAAVLSGRTYAEVTGVTGVVNTGVAFANPNSTPVTITFYFTNSATGTDFGQGSFILQAGAQMAAFLWQSPFNATLAFTGSFTFTASAPVGVIALRGFTNERGDFLITTQPIVALGASASAGPIVMAQYADGGGWKTTVVLINSGDTTISGNVQFYSEGSASAAATPITLSANGQVSASFAYSIQAHGSFALTTSGLGSSAQVGSVVVTPASSSSAPSGYTLYAYVSGGVTVTAASAIAQPASTAFRMYVEASGSTIQSGVAIANTSSTATTVNLELFGLNGVSTGLTTSVTVGANGHTAKFLSELFPSVSASFKGILRITAPSPVVVVGLRGRYNERGDFLITTTPASNETSASASANVVFPHIVSGGGYTTQFVLFSATSGQAGNGTVNFFNQSGSALLLTYQ